MEYGKPYREQRPWGSFEEFTENEKSTVKIITVNPHQAFSLQRHEHREERWHIISGQGTVTIGEENFPTTPGDEFDVKPGVNHRIEAGESPVVVLEISIGDFSEEDIIRLKDKYGRV